jgi:hypothetical protein
MNAARIFTGWSDLRFTPPVDPENRRRGITLWGSRAHRDGQKLNTLERVGQEQVLRVWQGKRVRPMIVSVQAQPPGFAVLASGYRLFIQLQMRKL